MSRPQTTDASDGGGETAFLQLRTTDPPDVWGEAIHESGVEFVSAVPAAADDAYTVIQVRGKRSAGEQILERLENGVLDCIQAASTPDIPGIALPKMQLEYLALAYDEGYFNNPRETTQAELAELAGCSSSNLTIQLRQSMKAVAEQFVCADGGEAVVRAAHTNSSDATDIDDPKWVSHTGNYWHTTKLCAGRKGRGPVWPVGETVRYPCSQCVGADQIDT